MGSGMAAATLVLALVAATGGFSEPAVERRTATIDLSDDEVAALAAAVRPSVVGLEVEHDDGWTSGNAVVLRSDGYLVTTASLLSGSVLVRAHLDDGDTHDAEVVGRDTVTDIAVLRIDRDDMKAASIGSAAGLQPGDKTVALRLHEEDAGWKATTEVRTVTETGSRVVHDSKAYHGMVLLTSEVSEPVPGSPVLDSEGSVIALSNGFTGGEATESLVAATPVDVAAMIADQIIEHGRATHVWLGVGGSDLDPESADSMGLEGGAKVSDVKADSPAAAAGLTDGDVIVDVDGEDVNSMSDLITHLREHEPGDEISITVRRGDEVENITTELSERSEPATTTPTTTPPTTAPPPSQPPDTTAPPATPTAPTTPGG